MTVVFFNFITEIYCNLNSTLQLLSTYDEYTRQTQNMCSCYNIKLIRNEMTVVFFNFITEIYCNLNSTLQLLSTHDEYTRQTQNMCGCYNI